jgi:hypothetical protein
MRLRRACGLRRQLWLDGQRYDAGFGRTASLTWCLCSGRGLNSESLHDSPLSTIKVTAGPSCKGIRLSVPQAAFCCLFHLAQRAFCAARIPASPAADSRRFVRIGIGTFDRVGLSRLSLALLTRCAAAMRSRAAADTFRFFGCTPLKLPFKLPKMSRASSNRSTSACARSLSFVNCWTTPVRFIVPPRAEDCSKTASTPLVVPSPFDRRQECEDWLGVAFALGLLSPAALLLHPSVEHRLLEAPAIAQPEGWNLPLPNVFIECVRTHAQILRRLANVHHFACKG